MADTRVKEKIRHALTDTRFGAADEFVHVSDGDAGADDIHVIVVSQQFDGRRMREKHDLIWSALTQTLPPEEWGQVSLTIGTSPNEIKAH